MSQTITIEVCSKGCIVTSNPGPSPMPGPMTGGNQTREPFNDDKDAIKFVSELIAKQRPGQQSQAAT